jgi:hypothetical protein
MRPMTILPGHWLASASLAAKSAAFLLFWALVDYSVPVPVEATPPPKLPACRGEGSVVGALVAVSLDPGPYLVITAPRSATATYASIQGTTPPSC